MSTLKDIIANPEFKVDFGVNILTGKSLKTGNIINLNHPIKIEIDPDDVTITTVKGHRYKLLDTSQNIPIIAELLRALNNSGWIKTI